MKRLAVIVSCLFLLIAGAASAWASCKREPFSQPESSSPGHAHDHGSDSDHHEATLHCPTLEVFLLIAVFSPNKNDREEPIALAAAAVSAQFAPRQLYRSLHGPPGYSRFSNIPPYLVLSVLRI